MSWARFAKPWFAKRRSLLCLSCLGVATSLGMAFAHQPAGAEAPVPSEAEQQHMLEAMRNYAADYTDRLPNFICQQTVAQFEAGRKPTHWHKGDTLTSKLVFNNGKEERTLEAVNDTPVGRNGRAWRTPLTTAGEFGMWLSNIFNPATETKFTWARWDTLGDRRVAKFDYSVSKEHSTLSLSLSDLAKALVAYHGSVYADSETGAVWKIVTEADDIPPQVRTRSTATTIDYENVRIGTQDYLLPVRAEVLMVTDTNHIRNEMQFAGYRKFEAESSISFGDESESGTKQPPKPQ